MERFRDRRDAGRRLGARLADLASDGRLDRPVVLGLPRGGVPVADEVARALDAPLDVLVVRKLGMPGQPEVAIGAVGEDAAAVWNAELRRAAHASGDELDRIERRERSEVAARVERFRGGRHAVDLRGRTAVIVDDGVATGATARVACGIARALGAERVVLAAPVGPPGVDAAVPEADDVVCLATPTGFMAVGMHYLDFTQTSDDEVSAILAARRPS
ncbi:phosphoribosyltransferase family protein [Agromyces sp. G08B096]|uniref:Phosphoribosyltransferase family protein n=1 Tax=Agromyces sp. G08B096 TaxID=3156399 RepID=A0AAU7WBV1_9MICO